MKYFKIVIAAGMILFTSCQLTPNKLVGHSYIIHPVNDALKLRLLMGLNTITHEYENNSAVKVVTWQGKEPVKSEELNYSIDGNTYRMDNEVYDLSFRKDTVILSIQGSEYIRLVPVN